MLRPKTALGLVVVITAACGGSPPPPAVVRPPPLVITAAPPPPQRARWSFAHPERGLVAKLDLGDGTTLFVGQNGRRELLKGSDFTDAPTLAYDNLVGMVKDDKGQIAFLADDGDVFVAATPLGAFDTTREGPLAKKGTTQKLTTPTTGKSAFMGIADGKLWRSADYGKTWKEVDYLGANKMYGKPTSVALDGNGNGLLLHLPQRLFVTHDDGASWQPIASPGIGARRVRRDGAGKLLLDGLNYQRAKLDGNALVSTSDQEQPIYKAGQSPSGNVRRQSLLVGDRLVELATVDHKGKTLSIEVTSTKLGEKADKPVQVGDLAGYDGLSEHVAGYKSDVVYLRDDIDGEDPAPTSTMFRSTDFGATWHKDVTFQGVTFQSSEGAQLAVGPKGWTYIGSLCPRDGEYGDEDDGDVEQPEDYNYGRPAERTECSHNQIKVSGGSAFEDMAFIEEFVPESFVFDEKNDKVYALGTHNDHKYVYESALAQNKFSRVKIIEADAYAPVSLTVDAKGTLRVFEWDNKKGWILRRRDASGKDQPPLYVPLARGQLALTGDRGVLFAGHESSWETNDGGESWIRVASNGSVGNLMCTEAGCVNGDAQRVGWDLPAVKDQEKIAALSEPKEATKPPPPPPTPSPAMPQLELVCKTSGAPTTIASVPAADMVDNHDARWASIKREGDGKASVLVASKGAVKELPILPAIPKPAAGAKGPQPEHRQGEHSDPNGIVFAHYAFLPSTGQGYNPVDVELGWYNNATGKVQHQTLSKFKAFRVSRYGFSGSAAIVDGGLLFRSEYNEPIQFIHDDGKVETFTIPNRTNLNGVLHLGKRWVFGDTDTGGVTLGLSDDNGKTWKTKAWGLDDSGWPSLTLLDSKPTISVSKGTMPALLFDVGAMPDDPPAPTVVDQTNADVVCDAKAGRVRITQFIPYEKRTLKAILETTKGKDVSQTRFAASTRVMHDVQGGKMCTSAYVASGSNNKTGESETAFLYPEGKDWSGWRFRRSDDKTKYTYVAEPLTCAPPK